jgi:nucleotide-binding universal stress UspA family protein/uncharacterized ParB-like nuclease family protein
MTDREQMLYQTAVADFKHARRAAAMQQLLARLQGKSVDLLPYEEIRNHLKPLAVVERGVQEIPLAAIIGSVGRAEDFTRDFLPKNSSDIDRWARVKAAVLDMKGMPPIDVYKVGEAYFVIDGNHRVSISRRLRAKTITARVTEIQTRVPLETTDDPTEIVYKSLYAAFLEATDLDKYRPDADLLMTTAPNYTLFQRQIELYRQTVANRLGRDIDQKEAVCRWYDEVYMPVIRTIREQGVLRHFPGRKEADLYLLLSQRQSELEEALGWEISQETAVIDIASEGEAKGRGLFSRLGNKLLDLLMPVEFEDGPQPGAWRQLQVSRRREILFAEYLILIEGRESDWHMLNEVLTFARKDRDHMFGLHVVPTESAKQSAHVAALRTRFERSCAAAGLEGDFAVEAGDIVEVVLERAVWTDLVVLSLTNPPGKERRERLGNKFLRIIQRCPRPILAVPEGAACTMDRVLLAYDGSPKAEEALFVAAYWKLRWGINLTIVTVETDYTSAAALERARSYLTHRGVKDAQFVLRQKPIAAAVLQTAVEHNSNCLVMGGFGFRPVMHLVLGSTVDQILREFKHPILICR